MLCMCKRWNPCSPHMMSACPWRAACCSSTSAGTLRARCRKPRWARGPACSAAGSVVVLDEYHMSAGGGMLRHCLFAAGTPAGTSMPPAVQPHLWLPCPISTGCLDSVSLLTRILSQVMHLHWAALPPSPCCSHTCIASHITAEGLWLPVFIPLFIPSISQPCHSPGKHLLIICCQAQATPSTVPNLQALLLTISAI